MRFLIFVCVLLWACEGTRTGRTTSGATGAGPDFNGGFDRRPFRSYPLPDAGMAYEWPTSPPDGWTVEDGAWGVGLFDLYGDGMTGGAPLMCPSASGAEYPCAGTGIAPNNSALSVGVCQSYNGGCVGANAIRSAHFPVTGGARYALSAFMHGRVDFSDFTGTRPTAGLVFEVDWYAGAAPLPGDRIPDDLPLTDDWAEHRFSLAAPSTATEASIRIELARTKRDLRVDNVALLPQ